MNKRPGCAPHVCFSSCSVCWARGVNHVHAGLVPCEGGEGWPQAADSAPWPPSARGAGQELGSHLGRLDGKQRGSGPGQYVAAALEVSAHPGQGPGVISV